MGSYDPQAEVAVVISDSGIIYVEVGGKCVARRGPNEDWISLDPEYIVSGCEPGSYDELVIEHVPTKKQRHHLH
jgi:hypothetical protein